MNIQRDINPENDKKLNKMLDKKFGKQNRTIVKGESVRATQALLKRVIKARKQFEDTVFNKPRAQGQKVDKHGKHDQRTHSPTGRAAIARERGKKPKGKDKKPKSKAPSKQPIGGRADKKGRKPGQSGYVNPDWKGDGPEPMFMQTAGAKVAHWIDQKIPGRAKRLASMKPTGTGSDKPAGPDNLNGYVNASYGQRKLLRSERRALSSRGGRKEFERAKRKQRRKPGLGSLTPAGMASAAARLARRIRDRKKVTKRIVRKHPGHADQSVHSPTGRAAATQAVQAKPEPTSSPAPTKVKLRVRLESAMKDVDSILDGLDAGTRLFRELKEAKEAIQDNLKDRNKVTKAKMTPAQLAESKRLAEDLKEKEGIDNPHALARWQVQHKVNKAIEKGIAHSLEILTNAIRLIGEQEAGEDISEADDKKLGQLIDEVLGVAGYLDTVKEQGHFEKGEPHLVESKKQYRPSFTTPAVAREYKRQNIKPNAKGRGTSTAREPGY